MNAKGVVPPADPARPQGWSDGVTPPVDQGANSPILGRNTKCVLDLVLVGINQDWVRTSYGAFEDDTENMRWTRVIDEFAALTLDDIASGSVKQMMPVTIQWNEIELVDNSTLAVRGTESLPAGPLRLTHTYFAENTGARYIFQRGRFTPSGSVYYKAVIRRIGQRDVGRVGKVGIYAKPEISTVACTADVAIDLTPPLDETWIISDVLGDIGVDYSVPISRREEMVIRAVITDQDPAWEEINVSGADTSATEILRWRAWHLHGTGVENRTSNYVRGSRKNSSVHWEGTP